MFSGSEDTVRWPVWAQTVCFMREIADEKLSRSPVRFVGQRPEEVKEAHGDPEMQDAGSVSEFAKKAAKF